MLNICTSCGRYRPDKLIEAGFAECPECGHRQPFTMLPLLMVTGASGAGKTTVCERLTGTRDDVVILDSDILWGDHFSTDAGPFFDTWLRVAKNLNQSGRPVVLFGAGTGVPHNVEERVERRYLGPIHYLALVCDDATLEARLRARPDWRRSGTDDNIAAQRDFNRWFRNRAPEAVPRIDLLDTTHATIESTVQSVRDWIDAKLR